MSDLKSIEKKSIDKPVDESIDKKSVDKSIDQDKSNTISKDHDKKKQAFITRTIWTIVMILSFFVIISSGHLPLIGVIFISQTLTFKEIISLTAEPARDKNLPYNKLLNWYFLFSTIYYLDGESLIGFFREMIFSNQNKILTLFAINHKFISYFLYITGFVFFVWTLKKGYYKFQFAQLCITHMTLLLVVFQSHLVIDNILNGIIWFVLPCSLVIVNDIFAYICGITFGKTQLIEISPKKTVEGFMGAWVCTSFAAIGFSWFLSKSDYMICPASSLSTNLINFPHCDPNPVFIPQIYQIPPFIINFLGDAVINNTIIFKPIYFHSAIIATFASLIAPFGGFFASGLKRAFGIKDFGDTIPGHGGITDRFDCQFLMGSFSYLYYQTFISNHNINIGNILQISIINLSIPQLFQLIKALLKYLNNSGYLNDEKLANIYELLNND